MAKTLKNRGDNGTINDPKHNVANRNELLKSSFEQTYQLDKQIKAATEKHIQPHRDAKSDITKRLRKDLNVTAAVFNVRYAAYRMERQAQEAEDETTLDTIREMFEIAPIGSAVNFLDAMEGKQEGATA